MSDIAHINRRILIVDDNLNIHQDYRKILSPQASTGGNELDALEALFENSQPEQGLSYNLDFASQGQESVELVKQAIEKGDRYAMAFVDMRMPPGWDGLRTIREIWAIDPEMNIVIATAYSDYSWDDIRAVSTSSDQLVILKKPFDAVEVAQLAAAMTEKWSLKRLSEARLDELEVLVTERTRELQAARKRDKIRLDELETIVEQRTSQLRQEALHDKLTGLPNRALFNDRLVQAIELWKKDNTTEFAILFMDFDRFKVVNDSLGHEFGDLLLISIAKRLAKIAIGEGAPHQMLCARLGGDEFCVLLSEKGATTSASRLAQTILNELSAPYVLKGREVRSTASIGITTSMVGYERAEDVVRDADNAMYSAKNNGKGRYVMFDRLMHEQAMIRLNTESDLRKSIELSQLHIFYQPIVSLSTGVVEGFESLARWNHPERGFVSPSEFIALAEEIGFISTLGSHVLRTATCQVSSWQKRYPQHQSLTLTVNVSRKQLADPGLVDMIRSALFESQINPRQLFLEITESALMQDPNGAIAVMDRIREMGVGLYLDDFGTGYSSLSCLHRFPLDGIKIDRSFIQSATGDRHHAAILQAIVSMARNLDMNLVAEGIETLDQVALLQALDCERGQGFLFARARSAQDTEDVLRQSNPHAKAA